MGWSLTTAPLVASSLFWKILSDINIKIYTYTYTYLRRQQKRGLMQKARRLMDENSVSFQMFIILLSSTALGSESQIPVFKEGQSNT